MRESRKPHQGRNTVSYISATPSVAPVSFIDYINKLIRRNKDRILSPQKTDDDPEITLPEE